MTRKSLEKFVDSMIEEVAQRGGYDTRTAVKGGQAELVNGKLWEALNNHRKAIIEATGPIRETA